MNFNVFNVLLILIVLNVRVANFNILSKIKNKATQLYKNKFGKDKSWHFLERDPTEYPGTKEKYFKINKQKWDDYYDCLKAQDKNLGSQQSITPEAVEAFEGGNVRFECRICVSPQEQEKTEAVIWNWATNTAKHLQPVQFTEHVFESPEDQVLHLYNLQMENTGQYVCSLGQSLTAPYFLTVKSLSDNEITEVHPNEVPLGPYAKESEVIEEYGLILDTEWGPWSTCSKCDKMGRKHKFGFCFIYLQDYYKESNVSDTSQIENNGRERKEVTITGADLELFNIFQYGIPCNSHILPNSVKRHPQVKNRKNEIMIGYCQVKCPKNEVFIVKDRNGNVVEEANNSAGIFSLVQSLPPLEPPIERKLEYGIKGKLTMLSCPGNMNSDTPVQWQIGNQNLIPEIISRESKGRIFISITDKIHINNARISDSGTYSCWQQKELIGTIRLIVEKKIQMNFSHHVMLLGILIVLSTFAYVFLKAFMGKKYAKILK